MDTFRMSHQQNHGDFTIQGAALPSTAVSNDKIQEVLREMMKVKEEFEELKSVVTSPQKKQPFSETMLVDTVAEAFFKDMMSVRGSQQSVDPEVRRMGEEMIMDKFKSIIDEVAQQNKR